MGGREWKQIREESMGNFLSWWGDVTKITSGEEGKRFGGRGK